MVTMETPRAATFCPASTPMPADQTEYFPIPVVRDDFNWRKAASQLYFGGDFKYPSPHYANYGNYYTSGLGLGGGIAGPAQYLGRRYWNFGPSDLDGNQTSLTIYDSACVFALGRFGTDATPGTTTPRVHRAAAGAGLQTTLQVLRDRGLLRGYLEGLRPPSPSPTACVTRTSRCRTRVHGIESVQSQSF